uniref:Ig-like domain-containing protein n=1 Tax=Neogobius melanostomus TaxID=47308 RepID=A0A8C6V278_9GOBI
VLYCISYILHSIWLNYKKIPWKSVFLGCFYNGTVEVIYEIDGDLALYADFQNNVIVSTVPPYVQFDIGPYPNIFSNTLKAKRACLVAQTIAKEILKDTEAPEVQENHLICFVNRFYPPRVKVTWTKNNRPVSAGVSTSSYMPNNDQTFHCFSTLTITPEHGDVYSCTVEHAALETPTTRIWGEFLTYLALDLYCGGGLTVAFVGVAIGTFLIVKGRYGH